MNKKNNTELLNGLLLEASCAGNNTGVIELISKGAEINTQDKTLGVTPIYAATKNNNLLTVRLLIYFKANLDIPTQLGTTPLHSAAINCYPNIIKILIEAKANIEIKADKYTPLYSAIQSKCKEGVVYLLKAGAILYSDDISDHNIIMPLNLNSDLHNKAYKTKETEEIYPIVLNHYWNMTADQVQEIEQETQNSSTTFEVVIVRYKEELSWVAKEFPHDKVIIYNKGPNDIEELPDNCHIVNTKNIGYLGGTYLKHIVDNYSQLADRTLFMQGHPYDVNTFLPLIRHKKDLPSNCNNIIAKCSNTTLAEEWSFLQNLEWDKLPRYKDFTPRDANMLDFHYKYIGNQSLDELMYVTYGAIFAVDKEVILRHGIEHYSRMLPEFNCIKPMADHYMEREWDNLFDERYYNEISGQTKVELTIE